MSGGGDTKELSSASSTLHPSIPSASLRLWAPTAPGLRAGPESLPKLRGGHSDIALRSPDHEQRSSAIPGGPTHRAGAAPPPARGVTVGWDWARRGRPDLPPRSGTRRLSGAPDRHPTLPPCHRRLGLTAPASSHSPRAHPPAGALRRSLKPCPTMGSTAADAATTAEAPTKPLVFVLSFRRPQGGGARDSSRRDPPPPQQTLKKSPSPKCTSPASFVASSTRLCFTEPLLPPKEEDGIWARPYSSIDPTEEGKGVIGVRSGRR